MIEEAINKTNEQSAEQADERRWQILQLALQEREIEKVFDFFRQAGVEPILLKGWAIARFYPNPARRFTSDVDLAVRPADYPRAVALAQNLAGGALDVDLHEGLRHLDVLPFEDLFEKSELVALGKTRIRVLCAEDHLRVLAVHWLTDGGANREKLWDIYYAVSRRPADFDWDRCLNRVGAVRRQWILSVIAAAHRYLNLEVADLPVAESELRLPAWFVRTIEKEWRDDGRLIGLERCLDDRRMFWKQLRKRFPPNPIHASVMCEAAFDETPRWKFQIVNFWRRLAPSLKTTFAALRRK